MNCKMARPHLTLDKWLSTDTDLKKNFLDQESYMKESLLTRLDKPGQKIVYTSTNHPQPRSNENLISDSLQNLARPSHINEIFTNPLICETTNFIIKTNDEHFSILKKKFLLFKYHSEKKKANRITKQITMDENILKQLEKIKKNCKFKSLDNCLEFLIDAHNFKLSEKDKIISRLKKEQNSNHDSNLKQELKLKDEKITELEKELVHQKNIIHENMSKSAREFEQYLVDLAVSKTIELEKIKASLGEISEEDQQTINETLAPEALSQIETQLKNECAEQKQFLTMKNQPNTNIALGFDQHSQYGNTVQNDDEVEGFSNNERSNVKN